MSETQNAAAINEALDEPRGAAALTGLGQS
jgi:hypothetical protein